VAAEPLAAHKKPLGLWASARSLLALVPPEQKFEPLWEAARPVVAALALGFQHVASNANSPAPAVR